MSEAFLPRGPLLMSSSRKKEKIPTESAITRDSFPNSKKIYVDGKLHDIKVAMREVETDDFLSDAPGADKFRITLYDTSGSLYRPRCRYRRSQGVAAASRKVDKGKGRRFGITRFLLGIRQKKT